MHTYKIATTGMTFFKMVTYFVFSL